MREDIEDVIFEDLKKMYTEPTNTEKAQDVLAGIAEGDRQIAAIDQQIAELQSTKNALVVVRQRAVRDIGPLVSYNTAVVGKELVAQNIGGSIYIGKIQK